MDMLDNMTYLEGSLAGDIAGIQGIQQLLLPLIKISLDVGIIIALATANDWACTASYHGFVDLPSHSTEVLVLSVPQAEHSKLQALSQNARLLHSPLWCQWARIRWNDGSRHMPECSRERGLYLFTLLSRALGTMSANMISYKLHLLRHLPWRSVSYS